jgi:hypothetical protein
MNFTKKPKKTNIFTISEEESRTCKFDNITFESHRALIKHVNSKYNINFEQYIVAAYFDGVQPICSCGKCNIKLTFKALKQGPWFKDFTKNHWLHKKHTEETKKQIRATLEKLYDGDTPLKKKVREGVNAVIDIIHSKENTEKRLKKCEEFWENDEKNKKERKRRSVDLLNRWKDGNGPNDPSKIVENLKKDNPEAFENWRRKVSTNASEQQKRNGTNLQYILKCKVKNPFSNNWDYFGSSWEFLFARWCFSMNIEYERNKITIPYINHKGNWALYTPDFVLPKSKELIEVKGFKDMNTDLKRQAAIEWCKENDFTHLYLEYKELSDVGLDLNKRTVKKRIKNILLTNKETMYPINPRKWFGEEVYKDFINDNRIPENNR